MKKNRMLKIAAFAAALCMCASVLSGCSDKNPDTQASDTVSETASSDVTTTPADEPAPEETIEIPEMYGTRMVAEGDVYAINKFTAPDPLPANYVLATESQEDQGKLFLNGVSKITVMACNYKEDFQALDVAMETACVSLKMNNMLLQCDTDFEEVVKTEVAGFEALSRDYLITANTFIKENPDDEGDGVKTPIGWYKARIVYFFSDEDVFYCIFETTKDDWDQTIKGFEEFLAGVTIDENAQNRPEESDETAETEASEAVSENAEETSADDAE